jgi:hypothetical protein
MCAEDLGDSYDMDMSDAGNGDRVWLMGEGRWEARPKRS